MKTSIYVFLFALLFLGACAEDKEIGEIQITDPDYVLPQGGNAAADEVILKLYEKYNTYFLYKYKEKDIEWTQTALWAYYDYEPIDPNDVVNLLNLLEITWFDLYDAEVLKRMMPYRIFLTGMLKEDIGSWWENWVDIPARYLENQIAINKVEKDVADMSAAEKREFKSYLQATFLEYCVAYGVITIPDEFYAGSDYTKSYASSSEEAREWGFVYNPKTDSEWSYDTYQITSTDDVNAYLASLVYRTTGEWAEDLEYPLIREKYQILVNCLKEQYGIDICKIGNTVYE